MGYTNDCPADDLKSDRNCQLENFMFSNCYQLLLLKVWCVNKQQQFILQAY